MVTVVALVAPSLVSLSLWSIFLGEGGRGTKEGKRQLVAVDGGVVFRFLFFVLGSVGIHPVFVVFAERTLGGIVIFMFGRYTPSLSAEFRRRR